MGSNSERDTVMHGQLYFIQVYSLSRERERHASAVYFFEPTSFLRKSILVQYETGQSKAGRQEHTQ